MATENTIRLELQEISPLLAGMPAITPYRLPAGYFEDLGQQVMMRITTENVESAAEELSLLSPLLAGLKNKPTFTLPDGHLDGIRNKALEAVKEHQAARVVPMFGKNLFKYAAAAILIGIVATAAWFFNTNTKQGAVLANNEVAVEKQIQTQANAVSDNEMINYLETDPTILTLEPVSITGEIKQNDIQLLLADVSDQELEQYLDRDDFRVQKFN